MSDESYVFPMQTEDVCYQYDEDGDNAVNRVSLRVERGAFVAVLGHNGSGKSTLAKLMNALFLPTEGRVVVDGLDLTQKGVSLLEVRKKVGLVFQYPEYQLFEETVA